MIQNISNRTISQYVREYIQSQAFVYEGLKKGIINYSKLAEIIAKEYNLDNTAAIKMSIIRFSKTIQEEEAEEDQTVIWNVLSKAKVSIKGDVSIIVVYPDVEAFKRVNKIETLVDMNLRETLYIIREHTSIVIIIERPKLEEALELLKGLNITRVKENATALVVISPEDIVSTSGVLNVIVTEFAKNKVNIEEIISCYRDTIIIVDEKDSTHGYKIVKDLTMGSL